MLAYSELAFGIRMVANLVKGVSPFKQDVNELFITATSTGDLNITIEVTYKKWEKKKLDK